MSGYLTSRTKFRMLGIKIRILKIPNPGYEKLKIIKTPESRLYFVNKLEKIEIRDVGKFFTIMQVISKTHEGNLKIDLNFSGLTKLLEF